MHTRDRDAGRWAADESALGSALTLLGARGDEQAPRDAAAALRSALEVNTRDRSPYDWASDQVRLGNALSLIGERGDRQALEEAVAAYRSALEVWTPAGVSVAAKIASDKLARAEALLARGPH